MRFPFRNDSRGPQGGPLLVVHVPKTAGTSFRAALCGEFPPERLLFDYGPDSATTSATVLRDVYGERGGRAIDVLSSRLDNGDLAALMGHFRLAKYAEGFAPGSVISFVREPLARAVSEYLHWRRHLDEQESFEAFMQRPEMIDRQLTLLTDWRGAGFMGLTERYGESLQKINHRFGLSLRHKRRNVARRGGTAAFIRGLPASTVQRFYALNRAETEFYRAVAAEFDRVPNAPRGAPLTDPVAD